MNSLNKDMMISYASKFTIDNYEIMKRASWWEVWDKDRGQYLRNPNLDAKARNQYNFSRDEAFEFVFKSISKPST